MLDAGHQTLETRHQVPLGMDSDSSDTISGAIDKRFVRVNRKEIR